MKRLVVLVLVFVLLPCSLVAAPSDTEMKNKLVSGDFFSSGLFQSMDLHLKATYACLPFQNEGREGQNGVAQVMSEITEPVNVMGAYNSTITAIGATGGEVAGDDRNEIGGCIYDGKGRPIFQGIVRTSGMPDTQPNITMETKEDGSIKTKIYGSYVQKIQGAKKEKK